MTYLAVVALIRTVSETVNPNGTFIHGSRLDGSKSYGDKYPVILLEPFSDVIDNCLMILLFQLLILIRS